MNLDFSGEFDRSPKAVGLYVVSGLTALLWLTERQHSIPGSVVAFPPVAAPPMFGIVGKKEIHALPWDVFWLMAGGISLGTAIKSTGLAEWMVAQVEWSRLGGFGVMLGLAVLSFALANFLSHTVAATRIAGIVRNLNGYSRQDPDAAAEVDLREGLRDTLALPGYLLKKFTVKVRLPAPLPARCRPGELNQVWTNLVLNACEAMGDGGIPDPHRRTRAGRRRLGARRGHWPRRAGGIARTHL